MQLSLGEPRPTRQEDGSVYMTVQVRAPGWSNVAGAIVVNEAIKQKAAQLLLAAGSMAASKATRLNFFRRSREALALGEAPSGEEGAYERAEQEFQEAERRHEMLFALAMGENQAGKRIITVSDWRDILEFFLQDTSIGSVELGEQHV